MAITYVLIASNTLSVGTASVSFSSIPNTYTDLSLRMSARGEANTDLAFLTFNSDGGTNYSKTQFRGISSTVDTGRNQDFSYIGLDATINPSTYTTNTFATSEIYLPSYTANRTKQFYYYGSLQNAATNTSRFSVAGLWRSTTAISTITLAPASGNFAAGSTFWLYGIKNT